MSRVFVTQENPNLDYLPAEKFGEVFFITSKDFSPIKNSLINEELLKEIRHSLKRFDPEDDFVVITGSPLTTAAIFMVLGQTVDRVNILKWSNMNGSYIPTEVRVDR